ncbi:DNA polymerase II [Aestuariibacter sp. AA17]|uniref:DNA polymerase n=1 Tax=Fluctibacter corallii TaxID=2984329 RepID=A0ABT3ACQ6_9ALTE|nr:DNA polymerase II [Aestuariibacter sp. AA17]MCV2886435.1 DNA polymerase II [Aestuariibacter sp. AA17]
MASQYEQIEGFLLSRGLDESGSHSYLTYTLVTDNGPVKLISTPQKSVFFLIAEQQQSASKRLNQARIAHECKALDLNTFEQTSVCGFYFDKVMLANRARQCLHEAGIETYEDDIRLSDRFLMERFVYGSARVTVSHAGSHHPRYPSYHIHKIAPCQYMPSFNLISLDIECSEHGELYSVGVSSSSLKKVLMIGPEHPISSNADTDIQPDWLQWVADETELLREFALLIQDIDPDIIIGWNVINFDFKVLYEAAERLRVPLYLGREGEKMSWRPRRHEPASGFVTIAGRMVIDGIDALKTATYHFDSFSLEFVAQSLLGKGKDSDDVDNRLAAIKHDFQHNKLKLAKYNLVDCELVWDIFEKTNILSFLVLRSQLTGLELDRQGGSVAAFINVYLPKLHRAGYISPNRPLDGGLASPGGYVMSSKPGLYEHVLVLDFKSLYPSIIRTFKIDPLGLHEGLKTPTDSIPGFKGAVFHRKKHFLPDIITTLWSQRDEAKRQNDAARSQAIKILMNSFYGVLGSGGCPFYDTRLASSITMRGHEIMQTTAKWIEAQGFDVIYGDTDSTFVWLKGEHTSEDAKNIGVMLQQHINQKWQTELSEKYGLTSALEIEFETYFRHFLMPTIRGHDTGSKKRYAGLKLSDNHTEEMVFKGLEAVRSDWTQLAQEFQRTLYQMVFKGEDVTDYITDVVNGTRQGRFDEKLVYKKRLRRPLESYEKNVPPHVRAARLADEINAAQAKPLRYQRRGAIAYIITTAGPQPIEYVTHSPDYDHYIDKQLKPVADAILPFIDLSFDSLSNRQATLF